MKALIHDIKERVEGLSLHDKNGWREMCRLIEQVPALPAAGEHPYRSDFFRACHEAFLAIVEDRVIDLFGLVAGLSEVLDILTAGIGEGAEDETAFRDACAQLTELTSRCADPGEACEPPGLEAPGEEKGFASLHEAGAFLIQLEPEDRDGILRLAAGLRALLEAGLCSGESRRFIEQAVEALAAVSVDESLDAETRLRDVGSLLEQAIAREEEGAPAAQEAAQEIKGSPESLRPEMLLVPHDLDLDLMNEFVQEGSDLLAKAEAALLALETDPQDMESVGMVFRAFHTVKGTSAFLGLEMLANLAHDAESLLSRVRDGEIQYGGVYADLSLRALDMLRGIMDQVQKARPGGTLRKPDGYDRLVYDLQHPDEATTEAADDLTLPTRVGDILVAKGAVSRDQVEHAALLPGNEPIGIKILKTKAATVSTVAKALRVQQVTDQTKQTAASVRVDTERLDRLVDLVGEMVIAHSMIAQDVTVTNGKNQELAKKVGDTSKIVRQLQDISMSLRMVPLKGVFQKMVRLVRDLSRKVSKQVTLVTEGEDTEIDRNMVDIINDPLVHMIRNAVDHGIEPAEERARLGKPQVGTVRLSAYHSAGNVVVEINDDGRGLDKDKILAKARAKGLIPEGAVLSDREIFNLVFAPGFSTAETVTDVSGRGVGMDVVKKNIESIRGQVDIQSQPGLGSTFKMALPLTLAIIDGMIIRVGHERYILPTSSVVRSVKPARDDVSTVLERGEMIRLQGGLIPLFRLSRLFQIPGAEENVMSGIVTVIENDGKQVALLVDELVGRQQIVIKSLGEALRKVQGIAGGAVMPDGRIGLILDVGGLVRLAVKN